MIARGAPSGSVFRWRIKMDFKNHYEKNIIKKCDVCGQVVLVNQFGKGECANCGWYQGKNEEEFEKRYKVSYPNLVPLSKAREQYKKGLPFAPSFEDFMNGLYFYSEMQFEYENTLYAVILRRGGIEFSIDKEHDFFQKYSTREEFMAKANIGGKLLKDIWADIKNPTFMECY